MTKGYLLNAKWGGNKEYHTIYSQRAIIKVNKQKYQVKLKVVNSLIDVGEQAEIQVTVYNELGERVQCKNLSIYVTSPDNTTTKHTMQIEATGTHTFTTTCDTIGVYYIYAIAKATETYDEGKSDTVYVGTGPVSTKITLDVNNTSVSVDSTITLKATLKNELNQTINARKIYFYKNNETTAFATATTNSQGVANTSVTMDTMGETKIYASFKGDSYYENVASTTKTVTVTGLATHMNILDPVLYQTWKLRVQLLDPNDKPVVGAYIKCVLENTTTGKTYTYNHATNSEGIFTTDELNFNDTTFKYTLTSEKTGKYYSSTKTGTIKYYQNIDMKLSAKTLTNQSIKAPYRAWNNLTTQHTAINGDGLYTRCGINCENNPITSTTGAYHTPSPITLKDYGFNIPTNSVITKIQVRAWLRTTPCQTNKNISIEQVQMQIKGLEKVNAQWNETINNTTTKHNYINPLIFKLMIATYDNPNITANKLNSGIESYILCARNTSNNTGFVDMDYHDVIVTYHPLQGSV